jgi:hypothetical protein
MKINLFANHTITDKESVKVAIDIYKSFVPANEEEKQTALDTLIDLINEGNENNEMLAVSEVAHAENIVKALIPTITLSPSEMAKSNARKNAVNYAVSYVQFKIIEDGKNYVVRETLAPVTLAKVYKYLCEEYASGHADRKVTKADREKALSVIFGGTEKALKLFCCGAFAYENITDKMPTLIKMTDDEKALDGDTPSKAKAEKQIKALATALDINGNFKRIHGLALYKKCYTLDQRMQPKTADGLSIMQSFITLAKYAINGIELPDLIDKGGILHTEDAKQTDNVFTFA